MRPPSAETLPTPSCQSPARARSHERNSRSSQSHSHHHHHQQQHAGPSKCAAVVVRLAQSGEAA